MTKKKKEVNQVNEVENIARTLVKYLGVEVKMGVAEEDEVVQIQMETDDPGVLIGYHGETLRSLQLILSMMAYRQVGEWVRLVVNVGDYRERRRESLEKMAFSAAQKAKFSGEPQALPSMSAAERRIVHMILAEDSEVETESEGENQDRRVVVKAKN